VEEAERVGLLNEVVGDGAALARRTTNWRA
jgi:hypothetical protein